MDRIFDRFTTLLDCMITAEERSESKSKAVVDARQVDLCHIYDSTKELVQSLHYVLTSLRDKHTVFGFAECAALQDRIDKVNIINIFH